MWKFLLKRAGSMLLTVWIISLISFVVIQLPPGDIATTEISRMRANGAEVSPAIEQRIRAQYGLDQPLYVQYLKWIGNIVLHGNFGYSFIYQRDASEIIRDRLPMSFALSFASLMFVWVIALPFGIYSAVHKYSLLDYSVSALVFIGLAVPNFLLALIFLFLTYRATGRAAIGLFSPQFEAAPWSLGKLGDLLQHIWIPIIIVGFSGAAGLIRTMRANLLDELRRPYVNTARAKGLTERQLLLKYPVRHALNPFVSTIGWVLPTLISGEAIASIVLNLPTGGPVLLQSLLAEDMYLAAGFLLMLSVLTVIGTFISDLLLAWLDPRIRLES